ncbi:hypothetical protein ACFL52_01325 [Candidatus Margulisiibacteriota bacterium]
MIREQLLEADKKGKIEIKGAKPLDTFYLITGKDYILLKKTEDKAPKKEIESICMDIQNQFKDHGIKKADINKAIKWSRKK